MDRLRTQPVVPSPFRLFSDVPRGTGDNVPGEIWFSGKERTVYKRMEVIGGLTNVTLYFRFLNVMVTRRCVFFLFDREVTWNVKTSLPTYFRSFANSLPEDLITRTEESRQIIFDSWMMVSFLPLLKKPPLCWKSWTGSLLTGFSINRKKMKITWISHPQSNVVTLKREQIAHLLKYVYFTGKLNSLNVIQPEITQRRKITDANLCLKY